MKITIKTIYKKNIMSGNKQLLTEIDRTKQLFNYTTKPKKKVIPEKLEDKIEKIEEGKIITLTDFLKG